MWWSFSLGRYGFAFAFALVLVMCVGCSSDGRAAGGMNSCVQTGYDMERWMLQNTCAVPVHVTFACLKPSCGGSVDLESGQQLPSGLLGVDIAAGGGKTQLAVCALGKRPVDASGADWTYGQPFRCE